MTILDPAPVDDEDLRADRRRRLFDALAEHDLDALVLGRAAEVTFASGARQLWTAGTRPVGPACVAVATTRRVHLLSVSDFDVPPELSHEDLFGLSWNPANLARSLAAIPGLAAARRVGTTSSSPGFASLVRAAAPAAEVVDGGPAMWSARLTKSAAEVDRIRAACAIAGAALDAMVDALAPGCTERDLLAVYLARISSLGAPTPPTEAVACATPSVGPARLRRIADRAPVTAGQLVALDPGAFHRGYEGGAGRTWLCPGAAPTARQRRLAERCRAGVDAVLAACRPGATGAELCAAWETSGAPLPPVALVHGVGLGMEPPVIGAGVGAASTLTPSMVVAVTGWVAEDDAGGFLERELVVVRDDEPEVLSRGRHGAFAEPGTS